MKIVPMGSNLTFIHAMLKENNEQILGLEVRTTDVLVAESKVPNEVAPSSLLHQDESKITTLLEKISKIISKLTPKVVSQGSQDRYVGRCIRLQSFLRKVN
jgi:hypothetical protein